MKLDGELTIGRVSPALSADVVRITIEDADARVRAITIEVSMEEFANALTALGSRPCTFEMNTGDNIGTVGESKTELVPTPQFQVPDDLIDSVLAPFRVDGWRERKGDITNHHDHFENNGQHYQRVVFFRNVKKPEVKL